MTAAGTAEVLEFIAPETSILSPAEVTITEELFGRPATPPDYLREKLALQDLAACMADQPSEVLSRLVTLALESCEGDSAGISLLDPLEPIFTWTALRGSFAVFEGTTTPRFDSPCGVCLDEHKPVLMRHPEAAYTWIRDVGIVVPEVLLVPLLSKSSGSLGTLWVVAKPGCKFDASHARVMTELAVFTGIAVQMGQTEDRLRQALKEQQTLTGEMSHRVKNVFAIADGLIRASARTAESKEDMATSLSGRLHALATAHALVRRSFTMAEADAKITDLSELLRAVLRPYVNGELGLSGPSISLGERATNTVALIFHELATNAAKYGALSEPNGAVTIDWTASKEIVAVRWKEIGGPAIAGKPADSGFGSDLVDRTVRAQGGTIDYAWPKDGVEVRVILPLDRLRT